MKTHEPQAIVAHAWPWNDRDDPGELNKALVGKVWCLHEATGLPILTQGELAPLLRNLPLLAASRTLAPGRYFSTHDMALWTVRECRKRWFTHVLLVTHKLHYERAGKATRKVGIQVWPSALDMPEIYDRRCPQRRWRYQQTARIYESLMRRVYRARGFM